MVTSAVMLLMFSLFLLNTWLPDEDATPLGLGTTVSSADAPFSVARPSK